MKTGILLVAHSEKMAKGLAEILEEVNNGKVKIATAAGTHNGRLGTSAIKIAKALEEMKICEAIFVFTDLGSSIVTTKAALELIDEGLLQKIHTMNAPFVEGAFGATVRASIDLNIPEIIRTAQKGARMEKFGTNKGHQ